MMVINYRMIRTMIFLSAAAAMLLLSACASPKYVWYQPGKDRPAFMKDKFECDEESALYAKQLDRRGDQEVISRRLKECMDLRGYLRVREEEVPSGAYRF